jgi:serine/threonine protein kinase
MLTPAGIKVLDFGIAGTALSDHTLTQSNAVIGTFNYMAPEQRQGGQRVDRRADLFALGVIIYRMLTGQLPIGTYAPPSALVSGLSRRWDRLVARALQPAVDRRYQSAAELSADLAATASSRRALIGGALAAALIATAAIATAIGIGHWFAATLPDGDAGQSRIEDAASSRDARAEDARVDDAGVGDDAARPDTAPAAIGLKKKEKLIAPPGKAEPVAKPKSKSKKKIPKGPDTGKPAAATDGTD